MISVNSWPETRPGTASRAARVVRTGGVLLYPTATVYGLGCDPRDADAVRRIRALKGRDERSPLLILTDEWERVASWIVVGSDAQRRLMERVPPLAVTVLFELRNEAFAAVRGTSSLVGIRATGHPFCRELIERVGIPVVSTSANPTGAPSPRRFDEIDDDLLRAVDGAVESDEPLDGAASTVVRFDDGRLEILREGAVPPEELERIVG